MKTYTVAALGCGGRGVEHVLAITGAGPRLKLTALCDLDEAKCKDVAAQVGGDLRLYDDAVSMLAAERPDIFTFTTPPAIRLELVRLGVQHGVKAIVIEKPMALSLAEAREICRITDEAGVKLLVCQQHKYGEHWRKVKEKITSGELGRIRTIHVTTLGWMHQMATHMIDYMMWLNDYSRALRVVGHIHGRDRLRNEENHPSPDYLFGQVVFANGVRGIVECGSFAPEQEPGVEFWVNGGATVVGSTGLARVVSGRGWEACTPAGTFADPKPIYDGVTNTIPLYIGLADWLDDPARSHESRCELSYHGYEVMTGICVSALDRKLVELPLKVTEDIVERMRAELSAPL